MTRSEGAGVAIAVVVHAGLFLWLSLVFLTPAPLPHNEPIEVSLTDEVGLESQAPTVSHEKLAAKLSPVEAPVEPDEAPPAPDEQPQPPAKVKPAPAKPTLAPDAQKPQPPTATDSRGRRRPDKPVTPTGNLTGLLDGKSNNKTDSTATAPPATAIGATEKSALINAIRRQLKPHWKSPTGSDVDKLITLVRVQLAPDGSVVSMGDCKQPPETITPSNRGQAALHCERAKRAIQLAAPFDLPANLYAAWKTIEPQFDKRLSQ